MVVCVHLPRFELTVAAGGRSEVAQQALAGQALAIAPTPGREARVGEVSGAAEAFGVASGMAVGEALARCPHLLLVAGDPLGVAREWERVMGALEGIGAALEPARPGLAYFEADGLRGLHGGVEGVLAAARAAVGRPMRVGAAPTRFCALAAALAARSRRAAVVGEGRGRARGEGRAHGKGRVREEGRVRGEGRVRQYLAAQPVALLGYRAETAALVEPLTRLGIDTLGELAELGRDAVADRFGPAGALARRLARGEDDPLRARLPAERLRESWELEDASSGPALERVLGVLVDRLLASPRRRGRTLRALTLSARLVEGGTWRERVVLREALSDPRRVRLALAPRLALLPAPATALHLEAERLGPPEGEQRALGEQGREIRDAQLLEAVAQARAAAGPEAALRAVCVDPDSRVPERRVVFTPFPG